MNAIGQNIFLAGLPDRGLLKVSGEDAKMFLQNQLSNDINNVSPNSYQESAWCSPKGRIKANFRVFKREEVFYLSVSADLLDSVIKKMGMYIMMSNVQLEDANDSLTHFGFFGDNADQVLHAFLESNDNKTQIPAEPHQAIQYRSLSILRITGASPRFEVFGELDDASQLREYLLQQATETDTNSWNYQDIVAGLPFITRPSSEAWIPQMVNYIAIDGVDFKKGCYPGQEVVARLNYLGKTKRRMYRLKLDTQKLPQIGDVITSETDVTAGKILNAAINPDGKIEALAVMKISEAEKSLSLTENSEATITILDLPYSVDNN